MNMLPICKALLDQAQWRPFSSSEPAQKASGSHRIGVKVLHVLFLSITLAPTRGIWPKEDRGNRLPVAFGLGANPKSFSTNECPKPMDFELAGGLYRHENLHNRYRTPYTGAIGIPLGCVLHFLLSRPSDPSRRGKAASERQRAHRHRSQLGFQATPNGTGAVLVGQTRLARGARNDSTASAPGNGSAVDFLLVAVARSGETRGAQIPYSGLKTSLPFPPNTP